ncbi:methyltransferase domain-containing protein [Demetria terragena]|uniref:methyltransferase domain-containing protein n=1 Tax=Demetria terragena TaxID=63959 RepID=UPI000365AABB|nr:methyltransferase domain-containing protein [Demetria terragena]
MPSWDPHQYERFGDLRTRPLADLLSRVGATDPQVVVDLGCGNGPTTLMLADRWPEATVVGVDSSPDMLRRARDVAGGDRVRWVEADLSEWPVDLHGAPDVIITNAALQWVPGHQEAIPRWMSALAPGGWFAMQVPGNFDAPSHRIIREVVAAHPEAERLLANYRTSSPVDEPVDYTRLLAALGADVDVWETTYVQILDPEGAQADPVVEWVKGTALRPLLDQLDSAGQEELLARLRPALAAAYPRASYGVPFPFRRIFAVAHKKENS